MAVRDRMPRQAGDVLAGKYRIERLIGAGGMGVVYAARHMALDEVYAIKVMRSSDDDEDEVAGEDATEAPMRFLREARACARLRGEHIARVHDVGELEDGTPYMVMEHLVGVDLRQLFKRKGALPVDDVVEYVIQTCEAIAEAHDNGIIHRDLKPANLFLTQRPNGTRCIKVLDFGISKHIGGGAGLDVTNTTDMVGSPFYMSPEQMRSGRSADRRSDIWSLGVVMYELAGGALPFRGQSVTEVCAKVLQETPASLTARVPNVSPAFERIVLRCLEKEADSRYQTAAELADALRSLRTGEALAFGSITARGTLPSAQDAAVGAVSSVAQRTGVQARAPSSRPRIVMAAIACTAVGAIAAAALFAARGNGADLPPSSPAASDTAAATASAVLVVPSAVTASSAASTTAAPSATAAPSTSASASASAAASASAKGRPGGQRPGTGTQQGSQIVDYGDRQ
jgi:hypothetical protein